ncbi:MAG: hypothetical protein ACRDTA_22715 [Pseudonocardiaceae bacterium]
MTEGIRIELDSKVLEGLASLICGDDAPYYRTGAEIQRFFEHAGWKNVGEIDGYRRAWTLECLEQRRQDSDALHQVLVRLADPREYVGEEDDVRIQVVRELNQLLSVEGYQVTYRRGRPMLIEQEPVVSRPMMHAPVELIASLADIVSDQIFGAQLQRRLDEAHICWESGAPTAAIIMLGSVLEGVLYDVALSRHQDGKKPTDHLETLIDLAQQQKWIAQDVAGYAHVLRDHRNLVHPKKQWTQSYAPEDDTVRIAWNVVVAALNDLAAVPRPGNGGG